MLGAEVIRSMQQGKPRIDVKLGGAKIFIAPVGAADDTKAAPQHPHQGLDHFGFFVKDIESVVAALKAKGVAFRQELNKPRPGIKVCFLRGPQDISIELLERDPAFV
jgi:catechol 2,3-dioxygenase-like lactoylglutathione lyase family enzyme